MPELPDVIVLCGGAGSRLKSVTGSTPKVLASVSGRPFLEIVVAQLSRQGFRRVILAAGPHETTIRRHLGVRALGVDLAYSQEPTMLGTAGAARNAAGLVDSDVVLIMNGDSYTEVDFRQFLRQSTRSGNDVSLVVVPSDGREDCGSVVVGEDGCVAAFEEKQTYFVPRFVNAGIYLVSRKLVFSIHSGTACSWEADVLPRWVLEGRHVGVFFCPNRCTDIGTPDRYYSAQHTLSIGENES